MATTDEIIARTAPSRLIDHNLTPGDVESLWVGAKHSSNYPD